MARDNRNEAIRTIDRAARVRGMKFVFRRPGGNHMIYDLDGLAIPVPNSTTISRRDMLFKQCQPKLGRGWWR